MPRSLFATKGLSEIKLRYNVTTLEAKWKMKSSGVYLIARNRRLSGPWIIAPLLIAGIPAHAQTIAPVVDPAISRLAAHIGESIEKVHGTKVAVAELWGPEGQSHPIGKYLADKLAVSLEKDFPNLQVIHGRTNASDHPQSGDMRAIVEEAKTLGRLVGANIVIAGTFARVPQGIGVSLSPEFCNESRRSPGLTTGLIPITDEIAAASPDPIPSPADGIAIAGTGGTTIPSCLHCPFPAYSREAKAAKYQGTVVLEIVVSAKGRSERITVVKGPGLGLEERSIEAVKKWRFKPAVGPDGNPVAVRVPVEISFRLY
jgi:TonB family protein